MTEQEKEQALGAVALELQEVIDPEIGYHIVGIGLVYALNMDDEGNVGILMTTTTKGCPATNYLKQGAYDAAMSVPGVNRTSVSLTYDPPWTHDMMSDECREFLGFGSGW